VYKITNDLLYDGHLIKNQQSSNQVIKICHICPCLHLTDKVVDLVSINIQMLTVIALPLLL